MKHLWAGLLLAVTLSGAEREGQLTLRNGDHFRGALQGMQAGKGLAWMHTEVSGVLKVDSKAIARIQLTPVTSANAKSHSARVRFANGDELAMDLIGLEKDHLKIKTWFAGAVNCPRSQIRWLVPGGEGQEIFAGPVGLRGWGAALMGVLLGDSGPDIGGVEITDITQGSPAAQAGLMAGDIITHLNGKPQMEQRRMIQVVKEHEVGDVLAVKIKRGENLLDFKVTLGAVIWKFENGALISSTVGSMVGRKLKSWPIQSELSFDLDWEGTPAMDIVFCADKAREYNAINGYKLRLYQNYAHLYRNTSPDGVSFNTASIGTVSLNFGGKKRVSIKILVDQKKASLTFFVGNKLVKTWKDPQGFAGRGTALGFNPQVEGIMKVSSIRLRNWNGLLPSAKGPELAASTRDLVLMQNGDSLSGTVMSIQQQRLTVKTGFADVPVPLENISNVVFAKPDTQPDDVAHPWFHLGAAGRITGQLMDWGEKGVRVRSPLFGIITLDPGVITAVQFR